jgi:hypothetical protein
MSLVSDLISKYNPAYPNFRPTEIYNENWLVKIIMHQAAYIDDPGFPLGFLPGSTWFSEGLLPTPFKPRFRGDPLGESRTHADSVIGHFRIGEKGKADLELSRDAQQFSVVEAKINTPLSSGITHARYYDQVARNVACMAEVVAIADVDPASLSRLDFIVLAPQDSISKGTFSKEMTKISIMDKVRRRTDAYEGYMYGWFTKHFTPTLDMLHLHSLSWESVITWISDGIPIVADDLRKYYALCLEYN